MGRFRGTAVGRRPRTFAAALVACTVLAGVVAAVAFAIDYSYITTGVYSGTAKVAPAQLPKGTFKGGSYKFSFRLTSATKNGIRTVRNMALGPVPAVCSATRNKPGSPATYLIHTLPRQTNFAPSTTNGFIVGSYVLNGGKWKHDPSNETYSGMQPHVDFALVYNKHPTRFNPNPLVDPSVTVTYRIDDSGKITKTGRFLCSTGSVVTVTHKG